MFLLIFKYDRLLVSKRLITSFDALNSDVVIAKAGMELCEKPPFSRTARTYLINGVKN